MKPYRVGYTAGVFDLFHVGHLNLLERAKEQCEYLIVGVTVDELVSYKHKKAVIPYEERARIVGALKVVDKVVPQINMNKMEAWEKYHFDVMFVGDDWRGTEKWNNFECQFREVGVDIIYFPYTREISSTIIEKKIIDEG